MKFIHPKSLPEKTKPMFDKTEKIAIFLLCILMLLLFALGVHLSNVKDSPKEFVCMQNIQYEIRNKVELHIILHKNQVVTCEEFKLQIPVQ